MNIIIYLRWFIVTIVIWQSLVGLHELSHYAICKSIGGEPSLVTILPYPSVKCENIINDGGLVVKPMQYFIYAIIPYILGLIAVVIIYLYFKKIHVKWVYILVSFILLDTIWNYVGAFFKPTDFQKILILNKQLYVVSISIVILIAVISVNILTRSWKEFKDYGQKVCRKTKIK